MQLSFLRPVFVALAIASLVACSDPDESGKNEPAAETVDDAGVDASSGPDSVEDANSGRSGGADSGAAGDSNDTVQVANDVAAVDDVAVPVDAVSDAAGDAGSDGAYLADAGSDALSDAGADIVSVADGVADTGAVSDGQADAASDAGPGADVGSDTAPDTSGAPPKAGIYLSPPVACTQTKQKAGVFVDVAKAVGIDFVGPETYPASSPHAGATVREGGGIAAADWNGDGTVDFYVASETGSDRLYLSTGKGTYKGHTIAVSGPGAISAIAADLDNDGDPDVIVGSDGFRMLRFDGGTTFVDVTKKLGLHYPKMPLYGASAADINGDGWLDFAALGHKFEKAKNPNGGKGGFPPSGYDDLLFVATGKWAYKNVTTWLPQAGGKEGVSFIGTWWDYDGDGDQDFYITNDFGSLLRPNELFRNDGVKAGKVVFKDVSGAMSADLAIGGMGAAAADYDHDGDLDIYVTAVEGENALLRNDGKKGFVDVTNYTKTSSIKKGVAHSWGAAWFDADNDGWEDLYVAHGYLHFTFSGGPPGGSGGFGSSGSGSGGGSNSSGGSSGGSNSSGGSGSGSGSGSGGFGSGSSGGQQGNTNGKEQPDSLLRNTGKGTFVDITDTAMGGGNLLPSRSTVLADIDKNGFMDLVVGSTWGRPRVYKNGCDKSAWLAVRLRGVISNRDGVGARVVAKVGSITYVRDIEAGSYGLWGSNEKVAHFGLGTATKVDQLTVYWPSGKQQQFKNVAVRRNALVVEPSK